MTRKECFMKCPSCGQLNIASLEGFFRKEWKIKRCSVCKTEMSASNLRPVLCPHCDRLVENSEDKLCVFCKKPTTIYGQDVVLNCPDCCMPMSFPFNASGEYHCYYCNRVLTAPKVPAYTPLTNQPLAIVLPKQEQMLKDGNAVWKHPVDKFTPGSTMQVNPNTIGILVQNGVCQEAHEQGTYVISPATTAKDAVVYNDIYSVLKILPAVTAGVYFPDVALPKVAGQRFNVGYSASIALMVVDAKAYIETVGFGAHTLDELLADHGSSSTAQKAGMLFKRISSSLSDLLMPLLNQLAQKYDLRTEAMTTYKLEAQKWLTSELNSIFSDWGLAVNTLELNSLRITADESAQNVTQLIGVVGEIIGWNSQVTLHMPGKLNQTANAALKGTMLLGVADKDLFLRDSAIAALLDGEPYADENGHVLAAPIDRVKARAVIEKLAVNENLSSSLRSAVQNLLDKNALDVNQLNDRLLDVSEAIRYALSNTLMIHGLTVKAVVLEPITVVESKELKDARRREQLRSRLPVYIEAPVSWNVDKVRIHQPGNPLLTGDVSIKGTLTLRVEAAAVPTFIRSTDAERLLDVIMKLSENDFMPDSTIFAAASNFYREKLNNKLSAQINQAIQSMIDGTNTDIRMLHSKNVTLSNYVKNEINSEVTAWGMALNELDITGFTLDESELLKQSEQVKQNKANRDLTSEDKKDQNAHALDDAQSDADKEIKLETINQAKEDAKREHTRHIDAENHKNLLAQKAREDEKAKVEAEVSGNTAQYTFEQNLAKLKRQEQLDAQSIMASANLDQIKRNNRYTADVDEQTHEDHMSNMAVQQQRRIEIGAMEHQRAMQSILNAARMDEAAFRENINAVMHRIDESNLTWIEKLNAYARMQRQLALDDQLDAYTRRSKAALDVKNADRESANADTLARLKLSGVQADLMEQIARYGEDRRKRMADDQAERDERQESAYFLRVMEERRVNFEQQLALMKFNAEQQNATNQLVYELEKLKQQLAHTQHINDNETDVERGRINADRDKRLAEMAAVTRQAAAESQARQAAAANQLDSQKELAERVVTLFQYMIETNKAIALAQSELQKAQSAAAADVQKARNDGLTAQLKSLMELLAAKQNDKSTEAVMEKLNRILALLKDSKQAEAASVPASQADDFKQIIAQLLAALAGNQQPQQPVQTIPVQQPVQTVPAQPFQQPSPSWSSPQTDWNTGSSVPGFQQGPKSI